jgi:hypothetical protein
MKIIRNDRLIKRNNRIGQTASLIGLIILAIGFFISIRSIASFDSLEPLEIVWKEVGLDISIDQEQQATISMVSLLLGFILSQVGIFFGNRYSRRPRPDELLDTALKGLDDRFAIFHYSLPVSHVLIGPSGIWLLMPRNQSGKIVYEKKRWKQKGGGPFQAYLRFFAQEGLGRPDLEIESESESLARYLKNKFSEADIPEIQKVLVITNEKAVIEAEDAPILTIPAKKLKETIRKVGKGKGIAQAKLDELRSALPME